ncbi:hypothetical protein L9F63_011340, partial [Diploptera punctata]
MAYMVQTATGCSSFFSIVFSNMYSEFLHRPQFFFISTSINGFKYLFLINFFFVHLSIYMFFLSCFQISVNLNVRILLIRAVIPQIHPKFNKCYSHQYIQKYLRIIDKHQNSLQQRISRQITIAAWAITYANDREAARRARRLALARMQKQRRELWR